jgi:Kef-type K+ transport system membrane component KefB
MLVISLLFGGLASATAPGATIAVAHELKAKGRFTTTLLGVVALDDALALIIFATAVAIGSSVLGENGFQMALLGDALLIILMSSLLGTVGALISTMIDKLFSHHKGMETISTLGIVFIVYSLSVSWELEPLFAAMVMGAVMSNITDDFDLVEEEIDGHLEEIIFMLFFILSAMHLKLSLISSMPWVLVAYVLLRLSGKVLGAYIGARISNADKNVQKYLGLGLLPQAGLAIGLALSLQHRGEFEVESLFVLNVVIATTVIHELVGPIVTRFVIKKSGEATQE